MTILIIITYDSISFVEHSFPFVGIRNSARNLEIIVAALKGLITKRVR